MKMTPISDSDVIAACHPATLPLKLVKTKQGIPAGVRYCNMIPIGDTHSGIGICLSHSVQHQLVRVDSVQPDGLAAAAGLLPGDIIWSIAEIWLPGGVPGTVMEAYKVISQASLAPSGFGRQGSIEWKWVRPSVPVAPFEPPEPALVPLEGTSTPTPGTLPGCHHVAHSVLRFEMVQQMCEQIEYYLSPENLATGQSTAPMFIFGLMTTSNYRAVTF